MDEFEVIKQQMEARRTSLAEKLEALETQVAESVQEVTNVVSTVTDVVQDTVESVKDTVQDTVQTVTGSVQNTVDSVKDSLQETVESVKETFDFAQHMERHPLIMMAGAFGVGFLGGCLAPAATSRPAASWRHSEPNYAGSQETARPQGRPTNGNGNGHVPQGHAPQSRARSSWWTSLSGLVGLELDKLKGMAVAAALGYVRDSVKQSMPPDLGRQVADMIDDLTTKLGAQPLHDNLAASLNASSQDASREASNYHFSDAR